MDNRFTRYELRLLSKELVKNLTPNTEELEQLAWTMGHDVSEVRSWFVNMRADIRSYRQSREPSYVPDVEIPDTRIGQYNFDINSPVFIPSSGIERNMDHSVSIGKDNKANDPLYERFNTTYNNPSLQNLNLGDNLVLGDNQIIKNTNNPEKRGFDDITRNLSPINTSQSQIPLFGINSALADYNAVLQDYDALSNQSVQESTNVDNQVGVRGSGHFCLTLGILGKDIDEEVFLLSEKCYKKSENDDNIPNKSVQDESPSVDNQIGVSSRRFDLTPGISSKDIDGKVFLLSQNCYNKDKNDDKPKD